MKKGDVVYISSTSGVEEGIVVTGDRYRTYPTARVGGVVCALHPDTVHATREEAESAVLVQRVFAASATVQSRTYDAQYAREALSQARFAVERGEANVDAKEAAVVESVSKLQAELDALAARTFGEGVTLRALGTEPPPEGAEMVGIVNGRLESVARGWWGDTYIVVRP